MIPIITIWPQAVAKLNATLPMGEFSQQLVGRLLQQPIAQASLPCIQGLENEQMARKTLRHSCKRQDRECITARSLDKRRNPAYMQKPSQAGGDQMKVRELIDALKQFPDDMPVLTDGYEGGYEEVHPPKIIEVKHEPQKPYYEGEYQDAEDKSGASIKAVVVFRNKRPE